MFSFGSTTFDLNLSVGPKKNEVRYDIIKVWPFRKDDLRLITLLNGELDCTGKKILKVKFSNTKGG